MALPKLESFTTDTDYIALEVHDPNWTKQVGQLNLRSAEDDCYNSGAGHAVYKWDGDEFDNDQYVEFKFSTSVSSQILGVGLRITAGHTTGHGYYFVRDGAASYFGSFDDGVFTGIGGDRGTFGVGDVIRIEMLGTTYTLKKNGDVIASGTDATWSSGAAGIICYSGGSANTRFDDWEGGNLAAGAYTLDAVAGSFSLNGQDSSLLRGLLLPGGTGSFILSGQEATLTYTSVGAYVLTADAGIFTLSGQTAEFLRGLLLTAEAGAFTLSGQVADLLRGLRLDAAVGTFVLTGQDIVLGRHITVICDPGVFTLTGQAGTLLRGYLLEVEPGVFVLTGLPATLSYSGELVHREVVNVLGEFTQLVSLSGEITQVVEVEGELTQLVEVSGELLEE